MAAAGNNSHAQISISGTVMSTDGPVPGVVITSSPGKKHTTSGKDGTYQLTGLSAGAITLVFTAPGFVQQTAHFPALNGHTEHDVLLEFSMVQLVDFEVRSTRMNPERTDASVLNNQALDKQNLGQDMPILLNFTPSVVTTSDAGNGVGYTGIRIRGSDGTRINVTVNGIPINDAESQGTFWVNMPDFASSTTTLQIQRGVGTSTNGAGAFGASVIMQTAVMSDSAFGMLANSFGSFNTHKHTAMFGTGWINAQKPTDTHEVLIATGKPKYEGGHFLFEGRLSGIWSDGYVDRAESNLGSYYLQGAYRDRKTLVRAITFAGRERTYQSWWGTPEAVLTGDKNALDMHYWNNAYFAYPTADDSLNLYNSGRTYNYYRYDNQVDNYQQDHYQLLLTRTLPANLTLHLAGHYTRGRGYYEEYRHKDNLAFYGLDSVSFTDPGDTVLFLNPFDPADTLFYDVFGDTSYSITQGNIIRRRWLDNHFYGTVWSLNYLRNRMDITLGGAWNRYHGNHFGEVIWAEFAQNQQGTTEYYRSKSLKTDVNVFLKGSFALGGGFSAFGDMQVRTVGYTGNGIDNGDLPIDFTAAYTFFNPKAGVLFRRNRHSANLTFAMANREPVRADFVDAPGGVVPLPEQLMDVEAGYTYQQHTWGALANAYLMYYRNQLVPTGALNDVGASIRTNVDQSYRAGLELSGYLAPLPWLHIQGNYTISVNRIVSFTETLYDYTFGFDIIDTVHTNTDIAFSPSHVAAGQVTFKPFKGMELALLTKFVGRQYLDNTSNSSRSLSPYLTNDIRLSYRLTPRCLREITLSVLVNNVLNTLYSSNGYTYSYVFGTLITENFYYPQAGINFLGGITMRF
jgi:iron complex outermembrane receptor protein